MYVAVLGLNFLVHALNAVLLQGITGGTVGKLMLGLRVVREDGRHAGIGWCALRTLLLSFVDGQCFIGLILVCVTKGHRRVGDMAASTFVVAKEDVGRPVIVAGVNAPLAMYPPAPPYGQAWGAPMPGWGAGPGWQPPGATWQADPTATATATTSADGPQWDAERDAYIQYDRDAEAWLQWDESASRWKPIDT